MLLQSGTSYNIQCLDIRTNTIVLSAQYTVQGKPFVLITVAKSLLLRITIDLAMNYNKF